MWTALPKRICKSRKNRWVRSSMAIINIINYQCIYWLSLLIHNTSMCPPWRSANCVKKAKTCQGPIWAMNLSKMLWRSSVSRLQYRTGITEVQCTSQVEPSDRKPCKPRKPIWDARRSATPRVAALASWAATRHGNCALARSHSCLSMHVPNQPFYTFSQLISSKTLSLSQSSMVLALLVANHFWMILLSMTVQSHESHQEPRQTPQGGRHLLSISSSVLRSNCLKCCNMLQFFKAISSLHQDAWQQGFWQNLRCDTLRSNWSKLIQNLAKLIYLTGSEQKITWVKPGTSAASPPVAQWPHLQALQQEERPRKWRPGDPRRSKAPKTTTKTTIDNLGSPAVAWCLAGRSIHVRPKGWRWDAVNLYELVSGVKPIAPQVQQNDAILSSKIMLVTEVSKCLCFICISDFSAPTSHFPHADPTYRCSSRSSVSVLSGCQSIPIAKPSAKSAAK